MPFIPPPPYTQLIRTVLGVSSEVSISHLLTLFQRQQHLEIEWSSHYLPPLFGTPLYNATCYCTEKKSSVLTAFAFFFPSKLLGADCYDFESFGLITQNGSMKLKIKVFDNKFEYYFFLMSLMLFQIQILQICFY